MEIKEIQKQLLILIKEFNRICEENNIWYTLTSGSVLGAVRHKGFIPWDTDIDIFVKINDMAKMRETMRNSLPDEMKLYVWDREEKYHPVFDRLTFKNLSHQKIHVDIFPLIGAPSNEEVRKRFTRKCYYLYNILKCKHTDINFSEKSHVKRIKAIKMFVKMVPDSLIRKLYHYLESKYDFEKANYVYTIASGYGLKECLPKKLLINSMKMQFEDIELPVPIQYHEYLTVIYGNYMVPKRDKYKIKCELNL